MRLCTLTFVGALILVGCNNKEEYAPVKKAEPVKGEAHVHSAPHGGKLIELGDHEYNAELVLSEAKPFLTIYVLGPHAEVPVSIENKTITLKAEIGEKETDLTFKANPQEKDTDGKSSRFELDGENPGVKSLDHFHASLTLKLGEKTYTGSLGHDHDHDEHADDHDHDDKDDKEDKEDHDHKEKDHKHNDHEDEKKEK